MVEFAILLPLLLLVLFGLIDMGRMFLTQTLLTNGAREGARMAALNFGAGDVATRADQTMPGLDALIGGTHAFAVTPCPAAPAPTSAATVAVTTDGFDWVGLGAIGGLIPGWSVPVPDPEARASMRCAG